MRYAPYEYEYQNMNDFSRNEVLDYFLTRTFEAEEIWTLRSSNNRCFTQSLDDRESDPSCHANLMVPVWPYKRLAQDFNNGLNTRCQIDAESLEDFLDRSLQYFIDKHYTLNIMPRHNKPVCLIEAEKLLSILEGMIDAGEYRMDA